MELGELRDRVVRLEERQSVMLERQASMEEKLALTATVSDQAVIRSKVDEMHQLLLQAKGARWAALLLLTFVASFIGYVARSLQHVFAAGGPPPAH